MTPIISRSARGFLIVAALLGAACGGPALSEPEIQAAPEVASSPTVEPAADAVRIVVLGDSLAAGMGLPESEAFPAVAETLLREAGHSVEVVNAGVSGDTTAGGVTRIDWVLGRRPQLLVVELGGNDALRGQPLENTERNLREIVRRGRAAGAQVLLLGMDVPSNYGPDYGEAFAEIYQRIAREEEGVTLVPGFVREVGIDPSLMQADGLHPTAEGQRRLAETLVPYLEEAIEELASATPSP